jgi:hypothetical protein
MNVQPSSGCVASRKGRGVRIDGMGRRVAIMAALAVLAALAGGATSVLAGGVGKADAEAEGSGLHAWGQDYVGQLGNGGPVETESRIPVAVKGIACAVSAAVSGLNSFAVLKNGTVEGWGADEDNNSGELGDKGAHYPYSTEPVAVSGITDAVAMAADVADAYVLLSNGTLVAWGDAQAKASPPLASKSNRENP